MITLSVPAVVSALALAASLAAPVAAAPGDRDEVLSSWTQTSRASFERWNAARLRPAGWAGYRFDWSTDLCTDAPDRPLGFDFRLACRRHDFGYRNYAGTGRFQAVRPRLDRVFLADLTSTCARYRPATRPACTALAWTYYQAVRHRDAG